MCALIRGPFYQAPEEVHRNGFQAVLPAPQDHRGNTPGRTGAALLRDHQSSKEGVRAILADENLVHFNWFEDRYQDEYEAGIQKVDSGWRVYYADEKAGTVFDREYADEAEAMTRFLVNARNNTQVLE